MKEKLYADRCPMELQPHFGRHMYAMTSEGLHDKADIALELAHRDAQIYALRNALSLIRQRCYAPDSSTEECGHIARKALEQRDGKG